MMTILIIIAILLWGLSLWLLTTQRQALAPVASFIALFIISLARRDGFQVLPVNSTMLIGWLAMTLIVMAATLMQPEAVRQQTRGTGYITAGALTGMVIGLLGRTAVSTLSLLYGVMIIATVAGIFLGFLLFTRTPRGRDVAIPTGRFFPYLLAKGFPAAITVAQIGIPLVLCVNIIL